MTKQGNKRGLAVVHALTIVVFLALLAIPIVTMNRRHGQVSPIDNAALPEWDESVLHGEDALLGFENYLTARIGLRTPMIDAYVDLNERLFGVLLHPTYEYGKEGYVFFHSDEERLDAEYLDLFSDFIATMEDYCTANGMTFLYCANPNKTAVYSEFLPDGVHTEFPRQQYLMERLEEKGVHYIDNTTALVQAKEDVQVFDVKYDAGHWNDNGAFVGMAGIIGELRKSHPEIPPLTKDLFTVTATDLPKLPLSNFTIDDVTDVYTRIGQQAVPVTDFEGDLKLHEQHRDFTYFRNPQREDLPKILVFRGSYFLGREKFMTDHFSESVFLHSYHNILRYKYYCNLFKPDIVLFESVEYATTNRYFPEKGMRRVVEKAANEP